MRSFRRYVEVRERVLCEDIRKLPDTMRWVRDFFDHGLDTATLKVWGDWLEENGHDEAANLFHALGGEWRNPVLKTGNWRGRLVTVFYKVFGHFQDYSYQWEVNDLLRGSWLFHPRGLRQMRRHIVHAGMTSYRLALTNGKWYSYTNNTDDEVSVVSTRHVPTPESERYYPQGRVSFKDYTPVPTAAVPESLLLAAFYRLIEKQVRGGH